MRSDWSGPPSRGFDRIVPPERVGVLLETVLEPGDRVCLEGNNQKQADFLAASLAGLNPEIVHDLHMVQSVIALPEHIELFEKGIARKVDFCYSGPVGGRMANLVAEGRIQIGAIHTYLELFGRYFIDLTPRVALVAAHSADREGNLYTGPNTEDTPTIVEATAFRSGIVIAQANRIVDRLPRVDIPAGWVDFVTEAPMPHALEPLFTRDPAQVSEIKILMAMMAIKGIYAEYGVQRLNHGVGFDTAAVELILPTYGLELGLRGKVCRHWMLNPHPTLIPAIESGFVESVCSPGSELGMEAYVTARPDVFFTGGDGSQRTHRAFSHAAGLYANDLFIGSTLQVDLQANTSTVTRGRIARLRRGTQPWGGFPGPQARQCGLAPCGAGIPVWRRENPSGAKTGGADGGDLPRAHAADLRGGTRCLGPDARGGFRIAPGDGLRGRCLPYPHRGGDRQSSAVPHPRGA